MSIDKLSRERGVTVKCDGTDETDCPERIYTANVFAKVNRAWATKQGWGRGLRKGRKRRDQCPKHLAIERQLFATQKADWEAEKQRRAELRKAKWAAAAAAKATATSSPTTSPSADSAPAPAPP